VSKYRIDAVKEEKFMLATKGGAELGPVDATDCEIELWKLREQILAALNAANTWICNTRAATDAMAKEKFSVVTQIESAINASEYKL